ncbi:sulfate transporter [Coemansia spiralis]|nr:sulfate transporter [Coemansia spiralis]
MREHFTLREFSGSLGDIGTLVPILISLTIQGSASLTSSLFFGGLWNILTGFFYGVPMCVQPMKSIAAIALTNKFTPGELAGAGLGVSAIVFFLGVSRLLWLVTRFVPLPVVKGLQLGTCFQLCSKGVALVKKNASFWGDSIVWSDNLWWACSSFLLVLFVYERRRVPVALLIFILGVVFALAQTGIHHRYDQVHPGGHFVHAVVPTAKEFRTGFLSAGLGQLPLTLLNSVVALAALARELFPGYYPSMTHITMSIGMMNLVGCFLGSMPFCHGSGGLAGQYFFGARTELSLYFLGLVKIVIGVVFGESLLAILKWFPNSFLGVMLFMASIELGLVARNFTLHPHNEDRRKQDFVVLLATAAALVGFSHDGLGFLVGMVTALIFWIHRYFQANTSDRVTSTLLLPTSSRQSLPSDSKYAARTTTVVTTAGDGSNYDGSSSMDSGNSKAKAAMDNSCC